MKQKNQCSCCGMFKPWKVLMSMANEDDQWFECTDCMSAFDLEEFNKRERKE